MTSIVSKPWGFYEVIEEAEKYTIKRITVKQRGKLSLQSHNHRSEHWIIVQGEAQVTINNKIKLLYPNESIFIPTQAKHRLVNNQVKDLIVIELWYGDILDENDIIRYEDIYKRT